MGSVTMLMLLMPDCRSASITAAKLAKGHRLIAAEETPSWVFFQLRPDPGTELANVDRLVAEVDCAGLCRRVTTNRSWLISFTVRVLGTSTSMPDCKIGAVIMK